MNPICCCLWLKMHFYSVLSDHDQVFLDLIGFSKQFQTDWRHDFLKPGPELATGLGVSKMSSGLCTLTDPHLAVSKVVMA